MTLQIETVSSEHLTLEIVPEVGASILNLRSRSGRPVLRRVDLKNVKASSQCASFTLLPFSNRIAGARFPFRGEQVQLRPTTPDGLTQHGDVRNRSWRVTHVSEKHLLCDFDSRDFGDVNWPWAFTGRVEYILHGPHLDTSVTLTNVDTREMPAGLGLHPYFTREQDGQDARLSFHAPLTYDTDARHLPTGGARPLQPEEDYERATGVGGRNIDQTYAAWDGVARLDWGERALVLTADAVYSHLVVFTAPDGSLALEPVTHATDAFNLTARGIGGTDMRTLAPGQSLAGTARITLEGEW
ncbi:aldose 1-epimerase [Deinococcus hopiensis]|uniref:Aldose 1-epimerase n=1 Tax=Deinococcus hopiensis KR-140 TaxID=695939 RepID=A0A1W1VR01_9DEIO|nr:aldose 1-epimerase [Deinococcus hopiensis]SMB95693.1 aldose 1-epimerase [Deinococcus hopiensis KR-140]